MARDLTPDQGQARRCEPEAASSDDGFGSLNGPGLEVLVPQVWLSSFPTQLGRPVEELLELIPVPSDFASMFPTRPNNLANTLRRVFETTEDLVEFAEAAGMGSSTIKTLRDIPDTELRPLKGNLETILFGPVGEGKTEVGGDEHQWVGAALSIKDVEARFALLELLTRIQATLDERNGHDSTATKIPDRLEAVLIHFANGVINGNFSYPMLFLQDASSDFDFNSKIKRPWEYQCMAHLAQALQLQPELADSFSRCFDRYLSVSGPSSSDKEWYTRLATGYLVETCMHMVCIYGFLRAEPALIPELAVFERFSAAARRMEGTIEHLTNTISVREEETRSRIEATKSFLLGK